MALYSFEGSILHTWCKRIHGHLLWEKAKWQERPDTVEAIDPDDVADGIDPDDVGGINPDDIARDDNAPVVSLDD